MSSFLTKLAADFSPEIWRDVTVLIAVSGGADSVALLRGLASLRPANSAGRLIAAHFNHRLRGAESDADQEFVRLLAEKLGIQAEIGSSQGPTGSTGDGLEAAAREARYAFLLSAAQRSGARYVLTAHTADDQVETVLHRFLRGTGLGGLAGIPRARELAKGISLRRPLLDITRTEVLAFLESLGETFREDSSNESSAFTRNRIRHELLPLLEKEYAPKLRASLLRLSRLAEDNQAVLAMQLEPLLQKYVQFRGSKVSVDCEGLRTIHRHLVRELFVAIWSQQDWPQQEMTFEKFDQLADLALSPVAAAPLNFPGGIRAERAPSEVLLTPTSSSGVANDTSQR